MRKVQQFIRQALPAGISVCVALTLVSQDSLSLRAEAAPVPSKQELIHVSGDSSGAISALLINGANILSKPMALGAAVGTTGSATHHTSCDTVKFTLKPGGEKISQWQISFNDEVASVEKLQDDRVTGAEAIEYTEHGEIRAMPVSRFARIQRARLHLKNGKKVLFWHDGWGAPLNLDDMGRFQGRDYIGNPLQNGQETNIYFVVELVNDAPLVPQPPLAVGRTAFGNIFFKGEPISFNVSIESKQLTSPIADQPQTLRWSVSNFGGHVVAQGQTDLSATQVAYGAPIPVKVDVRETGWFRILFDLVQAGSHNASMKLPPLAPSQVSTCFSVLSPDGKVFNYRNPEAEVSVEPYATLLGLPFLRYAERIETYFPGPGTFLEPKAETLFKELSDGTRRFGLRPFYLAETRPGWCSDGAYTDIGKQLAARLGSACKWIEPVNEPNFQTDPKGYLARYSPIYSGIKSASAGTTVLGPSCVSAPLNIQYLHEFGGAKRPFDEIAIHTYTGPGEPWELYGNRDYIDEIKKLAPDKPIWITEAGYNWGNISKREHARYAVRQFLNAHAAGIPTDRNSYFYILHNGFQPFYLAESGSTTELEGTLLPAAVALRVMTEQIPQNAIPSILPTPVGVHALRYSLPDTDVVAIWTFDFECNAAITGRVLSGTDFMGNQVPTLDTTNGATAIAISGYPCYLRVPKGESLAISSPTQNLQTPELASIKASTTNGNNIAAQACDGRWKMRDAVPGLSLPTRSEWQDTTPGASVTSPDWIEMTFKPRRVSKVMLILPVPAVEPTPRDFAVQLRQPNGTWKTAATVKDNESWAPFVELPTAVQTDGLRVEVTKVNDGWFKDGKWRSMVRADMHNYTDETTRIIDILID